MSQNVTAKCRHCGTRLLPNHLGPCPKCGKEGKAIHVHLSDEIKVSDLLNWEKRRTFNLNHKTAYIFNLILTFGSPFLGLAFDKWTGVWVGLLLGGLSFMLGPLASSKIIEITKGNAI